MLVTWSSDGITLEGLLAAAADAGPQRLLVLLLHGGPVGGLVCGCSVLRCRRRPAASGCGKPEDASRLARQ
jgi:hypothetical protein